MHIHFSVQSRGQDLPLFGNRCPDHAHALKQAWPQRGMHCQHCSPLSLKFHNKEYCLWKHTTPLLFSQKPLCFSRHLRQSCSQVK
uniref:Uncharacterized protein n=1 Tax=Arundo donax TaxID=35708 RepID=A0A0A9DEK6_ARUDO